MSDQDNKTNQDNANQATQEPKPLFSVGERTYDADAAKTKIINADNHISTIETENSTLKQQLADAQAKLDQATKLDDALAKFQGNQQMQTPTDPTSTPASVDVEALKQAILLEAQQTAVNQVTAFKVNEMEQANQTESIQAAQKMFGSDYEAKLREKGASMGMNDEAIQTMAKSNPVLFKQAFSLNGNPKQQSVNPDGSVNTTSFDAIDKPELKSLSKQWGSTAKVAALAANTAAVNDLISKHGVEGAARALGVDIRNLAL